MGIPPGKLDPELANDVDVVTRKSGKTPYDARVLRALEKIASYYDRIFREAEAPNA